MINPRQDYAWGSHSFIQRLTGSAELVGMPIAELWMGSHPKAPSRILFGDEQVPLDQYLDARPEVLGRGDSSLRSLPFLMKVLAAAAPLSIQAHPNQQQAREGFSRENSYGIPLDDPRRNYKDPNHKPELICALTAFTALCGFRPYHEIIEGIRFAALEKELPQVRDFVQAPSETTWKSCFAAILRFSPSLTKEVIERVKSDQEALTKTWLKDAVSWVLKLAELYPGDAGALAPLYLNLLRLQPLQALYLEAGIPHAYLEGAGIEVMANSDNVLRGGLTPKHIDPTELVRILRFEGKEPSILTAAGNDDSLKRFPSQASEFSLAYAELKSDRQIDTGITCPAIVLCCEGEARLTQGSSDITIKKGESAFCEASDSALAISGSAMVFICSPACPSRS